MTYLTQQACHFYVEIQQTLSKSCFLGFKDSNALLYDIFNATSMSLLTLTENE